MCFLFKFNKYLLIPILTDWLCTEELVQFETALTNEVLRSILSDFMRLHSSIFQKCLFPTDLILPLSIKLFEWAYQRNFNLQQLSNVVLTNAMMNKFILKEKKRRSFYSKLKFWKKRCIVERDFTLENRDKLFSFLDSVSNLKVNLCSEINLPFFLEVIKRCNNLQEIAIKNQYYLAVETIADYCPKLRICNLDGCMQLSEQLVISLCRNCVNLHTLNLRECRNMAHAFALSLITNCSQLRILNVLGCHKLTETNILMISMHCRFQLLEFHYREFSYLSLRTFLWFGGHKLTTLEISHNYYITETTVAEIGITCPDVTSLSLVNCVNVADRETIAIINTLPSLLDLTLQWLPNITDESFRYFIQKCSKLKELSLCNNNMISITWLPLIGTYCRSVRVLCLKSMNLTDDVLIAVVKPLQHLIDLDVSFNYELTNKALMVLTPHCDKLQRLHMSWWHRVTDLTFCAIGKHCRSLTDLNVDGCKLITDRGLTRIVSYCSKLQRLDITRCIAITPFALDALSSAKRLTHLSINSCRLLNSLETLESVIKGCKRLTQLKLSHITIKDAAMLKNLATEVNPDLELVLLYVNA